jgi:hypothetical protein
MKPESGCRRYQNGDVSGGYCIGHENQVVHNGESVLEVSWRPS